MSKIPQWNARVTKVVAEGTRGNYDRPAGAGGTKWENTRGERAYYEEKRRVASGQDLTDKIIDRSLIVSSKRPDVDFAEGDTVTFIFKKSTRTGRVAETAEKEHSSAVVPGTVRIRFEPT